MLLASDGAQLYGGERITPDPSSMELSQQAGDFNLHNLLPKPTVLQTAYSQIFGGGAQSAPGGASHPNPKPNPDLYPDPNPSMGIFDGPLHPNKRQRKSRMIIIDGNPVLRENNYSIDSYLSVNRSGGVLGLVLGLGSALSDGGRPGQFQTENGVFEEGTYSVDFTTGIEYFITSGGRVLDTQREYERALVKADKPPRPVMEKRANPAAQAHLEALRLSREISEKSRLRFVASHIECFRVFLSGTMERAATGLMQQGQWLGGEGCQGANAGTMFAGAGDAAPLLHEPDAHLPIIEGRLKQFALDDQPPCLDAKAMQMRDYQITGVNFLLRKFSEGMSCVLADEMGLGKTIQTIAFLGTLKTCLGVGGPHLVVVPMSVLSNWMSEFKRFCPRLKVCPSLTPC